MKGKPSSEAISEIMPGVVRITLPLPGKKPGPVNTYLFTGRPVTLIDTGIAGTAAKLRKALNSLGLDFCDIEQIVLTHGHIDHYGAADFIKKESRAVVYASAADREAVEQGRDVSLMTFVRFLHLCSVPLRFWFTLGLVTLYFRRMGRTCAVDRELREGEVLRLGSYSARILEVPGHSRGSVCLYLEAEGALFSGDHILAHITPNAFVMLDNRERLPSRKSQREYYASLEKIVGLGPSRVFPAHGRAIDNLPRLASLYALSFKRRQDLILGIIASGSHDVYSIAKALFPVIDRRLLILETYLMVSEVYTHLQVLEEERRVSMSLRWGRIWAFLP